jgi:hypothetical protein
VEYTRSHNETMNFKRQRPRVNYPLMKKGGKHMVSRKKPRVDGKKDTNNQLEEVSYVEHEETERDSSS